MPKESPKARQERLSLCASYGESGQTVTEFIRELGISYWRLKSALKKTERESGAGFQELSVAGGLPGGGEYTVMLRGGRELRLPVHFIEKRVRQLVEILETC
jgi:hypothetical protein